MISTPTDKEAVKARIANFLEIPNEDHDHLYVLDEGRHGFNTVNPPPQASIFSFD